MRPRYLVFRAGCPGPSLFNAAFAKERSLRLIDATDRMSPRQAAAKFGITHGTIRRWVERGALRGWVTPGGQLWVDRQSVDELLSSSAAPKPAAPTLESA